MKKISVIVFTLFVSFALYSQDLDYYKNKGIEGNKGAALKTALCNLIYNHTDVGYGGLYDVYETSDNLNGNVWDMYSTCTFRYGASHNGNRSVCSGWNREHMIPQSWFGSDSPMKADAFHVYPTDAKVNNLRSSYPHGETDADPLSMEHGSHALGKLGAPTVACDADMVYEPDDQYKGDVARTYFYFVTCYEKLLPTSTFLTPAQKPTCHSSEAFEFNTYPSLKPWFVEVLLKWHRQDPVSEKEINRNDAVYEWQHNRNPFIDYPELVEHIWGNKQNIAFTFDGSTPVEQVVEPEFKVVSSHNSISLFNLGDDSNIVLRDLCGRIIMHEHVSAAEYTLSVQQGLYLMTVNDVTVKVVVR